MMESPYVQFRRKYCADCEEYKYRTGEDKFPKICDGSRDDILKCVSILNLLNKEKK